MRMSKKLRLTCLAWTVFLWLTALCRLALADTAITLADGAITAQGGGVTVAGDTVTITSAGVYTLSGSLTDGQIIVDAGGKDEVTLILAGVDVTCADSPALYVSNAKIARVQLAAGTENRLVSGAAVAAEALPSARDENASGGALQAKDDLTISGEGALFVGGYINNGIQTSNCLTVEGGDITVEAANHGLKGKDAITVSGGSIAITCGGDGLQSDDAESEDTGRITITGGALTVVCQGDGVQAETTLNLSGGEVSLTCGGGAAQSASHASGFDPFSFGENGWDADSASGDSAKGLKAGGDMTISGGALTVDAADDAVHANGAITISGGMLALQTGDDGVHADTTLRIAEGDVTILDSYEGLEANQIHITGGSLRVTARDDGVNANGGASGFGDRGRGWRQTASVQDSGETPNLIISGGQVWVNAQGDGLDSNGNLIIEGGTTVVCGPTGSGNGALDCGTENGGVCRVNGGTVLAMGSDGMAETFDGQSAQASFFYRFDTALQPGDVFSVADAAGNVLFSYVVEKAAATAVFSIPELTLGDTYTLTAGQQTDTLTLMEMATSVGGAGGWGGRGGGRDGGGRHGW